MKTKTILTWIAILIIGFTPVYLLLAYGPQDYSSIPFTLGQIAGLIGMTFFALTFILSTRAKWVENLFDGQDKVYIAHGVLGATSLITLLFHPLLLVVKYLPENVKLAAVYLLPGGLWSVDFGIFALSGMIILIILTLYSTMKYHRWKVSHEFFGLVFLLAILHIFLIRGNGSRDLIFDGYYVYAVVVSLIGASGFIYSFFIRRLYKKKEYRVAKIVKLGNCVEIHLAPVRDEIKYKSGQFIFVQFYGKGTSAESHPFSIVSKTNEKEIVLIVKALGDYTSTLEKLKINDRAKVEGPYGRFHAKEEFTQEVWIAAGIGITPFLSLAEEFADAKTGNVCLFYCAKNAEELLHIDRLQELSTKNKRFKLRTWLSEKQGRISITDIEKECTPLKDKEYYLCGPEAFKQGIRSSLEDRGINKIHDERFEFK